MNNHELLLLLIDIWPRQVRIPKYLLRLQETPRASPIQVLALSLVPMTYLPCVCAAWGSSAMMKRYIHIYNYVAKLIPRTTGQHKHLKLLIKLLSDQCCCYSKFSDHDFQNIDVYSFNDIYWIVL